METSVLYVSRNLVPAERREEAMRDIIRIARARNAGFGVTGALIATDARFAQLLEGEAQAVATLMALISTDPRHTDVRVLHDGPITRRRFPKWSMAYSGLARYVANYVEPLLSDPSPDNGPETARQLTRLMEKLVNP